MNNQSPVNSKPTDEEIILRVQSAHDALDLIGKAMQTLYNLKGDNRDASARYAAVALTDLEKVVAYVSLYLIEVQSKKIL